MKNGAYGIISSRLIRTDRNGTKYYAGTVKCDRCGGAGRSDIWAYTGYVCYKCGGSGVVADEWFERTEEYEEKLRLRRVAKAQKEAEYRKAHAEEIRLDEIAKDSEKARLAIFTCNNRKGCGCETCSHKVYCTLLTNCITDIEEAVKIDRASDSQKRLLEKLNAIDRTEPVLIETLDGEPCEVSRWFTDRYGNSKRCITKPDGEKVYTTASTDRGLAKYGLRNRKGA